MDEGIFIESLNLLITVKVHVFLGDAPARSKACNSIQFNGKYGCIDCLHPTARPEHTTIYPNLPNIEIRTHERYLKHVELSKTAHKNVYKGIKGESYLSNWIELPDAQIKDYMHLCLQGSFKAIIMSLFNSINHRENYYLGKSLNKIDKRLLSVRLPIELARSTRSLNERAYYKANEWRTILFYLSIPLFLDILHLTAFKNLIHYVIFMRILCQEQISREEINDSQKIIVTFLTNYQKIYGEGSMTYNIHAHLHLPLQVYNYGPLNRCSCFPFENMFKISKNMFHGTVNFASQIAKNLIRHKLNKKNLDDLFETTNDSQLKSFISELLPHKKLENKNTLLDSKLVNKEELNEFELYLINNKFNNDLSVFSSIFKSNRAVVHKKGNY